ncbi:hypothetical protein ABPG75_007403 [Micractinium tetrahymenae]
MEAAVLPQCCPTKAMDVVWLLADACREPLARLHCQKAGTLALVIAACSTLSTPDDLPSLKDLLDGLELTLEKAVRELSPAAAALEPAVARVLGSHPPLAERIRVRELQQAFVLYRVLAKKAWDLFAEYFTLAPLGPAASAGAQEAPPTAAAVAPSPAQGVDERSPLGFFWLLFCTARGSLLPPQADLVTSFALLLACTHFVLQHMPAQHRRLGAPGAAAGAAGGAGGSANERAGSSSGEEADAATEASLAAVAAGHSAAEHLPIMRQLAVLLQHLAAELLLPAVQAGSTPAKAQEEGRMQQAEAAAGAAEAAVPGAGGAAAPRPIPGLFDAAGTPHPAAVAALRQRYQQQQQAAEGIGIDALGCLALAAPAAASAGASAGSQAAASSQEEAAAAGAAAGASPMEVDASAAPAADAAAGPAAASGAAAAEPAGPEAAAAGSLPQQQPEPAAGGGAEPVPGIAALPVRVGTPPRAPRPPSAADSFKTPSPAKRSLAQALPPATPISTAMGSTAWLRSTVAGQPEGPSAALQDMMQAARVDAAGEERLVAAARDMAAAVFCDAPGELQGPLRALEQSTVEARRSEGLRLYWRSLEALVAAERARAGEASPGAATALLAAPLFHRCVAACAFEVVIGAYRMVSLEFPAVLHRLRLPAFDLCKVLEPFVLQLPTLPRDLKRHLLSVEERCLESLAWQQGSSLYAALVAAVGPAAGAGSGQGGQQQQQAGGGQAQACPDGAGQGSGSGSGASIGVTPRKRGHEEMDAAAEAGADAQMEEAAAAPSAGAGAAGQQAGIAPTAQPALPLSLGMETSGAGPTAGDAEAGGSGGAQQQQTEAPQAEGGAGAAKWQHPSLAARGNRSARAAVAEFLRRVLKLVAIRLADLLSRLDTHPADPQLLLAEAYTLAQHVAFEHTWLLYGRHADQVMLCCLYAVCKVNAAEEATLRAIIAAYNRQPQARPETFKSVNLTPRERTSLSMAATERGDIITFYNKVFIPHTKAFLQRLAENRSLLSQPPACALPYLAPPAPSLAAGLGPGGIPPPPLHPLRPGAQTPCAPGLAGGLASPRGLLGTPTRAGAMQLLSPGAWRINRGSMTPLASPRIDQMAALAVAGSPLPPALGARATPAAPMSSPAIHHMFGPGQGSISGTSRSTPTAGAGASPIPPPPLATAAALAAAAVAGRAGHGFPQLPLPVLPLPVHVPLLVPAAVSTAAAAAAAGAAQAAPVPVSSADVLQLFAKAEASAAAAAAMAAAAPQQAQQAQQAAEAEEEALRLTDLPSESLPLLAAAAVVAEEIERKENEVAAAFAGFRPGASSPVVSTRLQQQEAGAAALAASQGHLERLQQPGAATGWLPAQAEEPEAAAAAALQEAAAAAGLPAAMAVQDQQQALLGPRHARRILNLQPAASPVQ